MQYPVFVVVILVSLILPAAGHGSESGRSYLYVSLLQERRIVVFHRDRATGMLTRRNEVECPAEPAGLAASKDGRFLFVSLRSTGQLASWRIAADSGQLTLISIVDGGDDPAFLTTDRTGQFLLTAYYVSNKVTVHQIDSDGRLSQMPVCSVDTAQNAHGLAIDSRNQSVYVSHTGANRIDQFDFHPDDGRLSPKTPTFVTAAVGQNPRHLVLHPSDRWAYCSNEAGSSAEDGASLYRRDLHTGQLTLSQSVSSLPAGFDARQNSTAECLMTPDGKFLYVSNRGHNSLAGFAIDRHNGELSLVSVTPTEAVPRSFTITADGRYLYAAGEAGGRVACCQILPTGILAVQQVVDSGPVSWAVLAVETHP